MNSRVLIRWSRLSERRTGRAIAAPIVALVFGLALAGWVYTKPLETTASHAWLLGTLAAFVIAFLRVPFLVYWRGDATILAQLPIEGRALFDAAMVRCFAAAITVTLIAAIGAVPMVLWSVDHGMRHVALAALLGLAAALFMPAVAVWAASLVDRSILSTVTALGGAPVAADARPVGDGSGTMLGAIPGFAGMVVIALVIMLYPWLVGAPTKIAAPILLAILGGGSALAFAGVRATVAGQMGTILRDVSALDRQRLATLDIRPPTAIEGLIARLAGDGALAYSKDARLVRRRYPMAFALGAIVFFVLVVVAIARPDEPDGWIIVTLAGATAYAIALTGRLRRPPIELPRVTATLPSSARGIARAKHAWLAGWWLIFVLAPGLFAAIRQGDPIVPLVALAASTVVAFAASFLRS